MSLIKSNNSTLSNKLFGYRVTTSLYGRPIPVPFGRVRIGGQVIWTGGWTANPITGGKGNKGKGGAQQYDYITNVLIALGQGPVAGVFAIWRDKDLFSLTQAREPYTIGGSGVYTTQHGGIGKPEWWVLNVAVARDDGPVTLTITDPGSPSAVTVTNELWTSMKLVPANPGTGEYTLTSDSSGYAKYAFATSGPDVGKTVKIVYSYQINNFSTLGSPMTHLDLVLLSGTQGQAPWSMLVNTPWFVTQVLGYSELACIASGKLDLGSAGVIPNMNFEVQGRCGWMGWDPVTNEAIVDCNPADMISDILTNPLDGVLGWSTPGTGTAVVPVTIGGLCNINFYAVHATSGSFAALRVGQSIEINGRVTTIGAIGGAADLTVNDSPVGPMTGSTWSAVAMQSLSVVTGSSQWLPIPTDPAGLGPGSQVYKYCAANGIFLSMADDQTKAAREVLNQLLEQANSGAFWSEGKLKFGCYGDTTAIGNGFTYRPATQPIYDIDDSDMICKPGEAPVKLKRPDVRDVKNEVTVEWTNRSAGYATNTLPPAQDSASVSKFGRRPESSRSYHGINLQNVAAAVQNTILKRLVYIEGAGTYETTLAPHFALLDPLDLLTITELYLGFIKKPLRIIRIEEQENLCLKLTFEEFPWSCSAPTLNPSQGHTPTQAGYFAAPGHVNIPQFVQLPKEVAQGNQYVLGIALSGTERWGGAAVFVSLDGISYEFAGMDTGAATMGMLTVALPASLDPDTAVHDLQVDLSESGTQLASLNNQAQADAYVSLIAVESELLSYLTADLIAPSQYGLTYLRRGVYGTVDSAHPLGSPFCVVDKTLFNWAYPASAIGKTVWFKFCSVNQSGLSQEDISQVVAYPCFIAGPRAPYPWAAGWSTPSIVLPGDPVVKASAFGLQPAPIVADDGSVLSLVNVLGNQPLNAFTNVISPPILNSAIAVRASGVKWVSVGAGGTGYLAGLSGQFSLTLSGGGGNGAAGYAMVVAGVVVNAIITTGGLGYTSAPAVSLPMGGGSGAAATAFLSTGGTLAAGTYAVGIHAFDAVFNALVTPLSNILEVVAAGNSELIVNVTWPTGSFGGNIFVASPDGLHPFHNEGAIGVGAPTSGVQNYSASVIGLFTGPPDARFDHFNLRYKREIHAGVWAEHLTSVGPITPGSPATWKLHFATATFRANQWQNRYVSLLAFLDQTKSLAVWNATVLSNDATTLTVSMDPSILSTGDLITMRMLPTAITWTSFLDAEAINCFEPTGFGVHQESGRIAWIIANTGAGQQRLIQENGAGAGPITLSTPWSVKPDATSVIIIVEPTWITSYRTHSAKINSYALLDGLVATLEVSNIAGQAFIIQVVTADVDDGFDETYAPVREIWMPGQPGSQGAPGVTLQVGGTLGIASNVAPMVALNAARSAKEVVAYVKISPTGAGLTLNINLGGVLWMTLTVAAGTNSISATAAQIAAAVQLTASTNISLDLTAVGTTFPGGDLSVFLYL